MRPTRFLQMPHLFRTTLPLALHLIISAIFSALAAEESAGRCFPVPPGAVAWWPADGDARNARGSRSGPLVGDAGFTEGRWGGAFRLDGSGDRIEVGNVPALRLQIFSIETWVRRNSVDMTGPDEAAVIFGGGEGSYVFGLLKDGSLYLGKVGIVNAVSSGKISDTEWHHVAAAHSESAVRFFIDGAFVEERPLSQSFSFETSFSIGALSQPIAGVSYGFNGLIDDLTIYNRLISDAEVRELAGRSGEHRCDEDVEISVSRSPIWVVAGFEYLIEVTVTNRGISTAVPLSVFPEIPPGAAVVSVQTSQGSVTNRAGVIAIELGGVPSGGFATVAARFRAENVTTRSVIHRFSINQAPTDTLAIDNIAEITLPFLDTPCVTSPSDLVAAWAGNGNTLEFLTGATGVVAGTLGYVPGVVGTSFNFSDGRSYLNVGNPSELHLQDFTFEAWVRRSNRTSVSFSGTHCFFIAGGSGSYGFGLVPDGRLYLHHIPTQSVFSTGAVTDLDWHHVAVTRAGQEVRFYIDGVPAGAAVFPNQFQFGSFFTIGGFGGAGESAYTFLGSLDELGVYSRALAQAEISALHGVRSAGRCFGNLTIRAERQMLEAVTGDIFTIAFEIAQTGAETAAQSSFACILPPGTEAVAATSSQGVCTVAPGLVFCDLGGLDPGTEVRVTLTLRAVTAGNFLVTGRIQSLTGNSLPADDQASVRVPTVPFTIQMSDITLPDGDPGRTNQAVFELRISPSRPVPVEIAWATSPENARDGLDFIGVRNRVSIPPGQTFHRIAVPIPGDNRYENDRVFTLSVTNETGGGDRLVTARCVISNDDPPPLIRIEPIVSNEGDHGASNLLFQVRLEGPTDLPAAFNYRTEDHTARSGTDYLASAGMLGFQVGETERQIVLTMLGDTAPESDEALFLRLSSPTNCRLATDRIAVVLKNDDTLASVLDHFTVELGMETFTPGQPVPATITARNVAGDVVAGFDGAVRMAAYGGSGRPAVMVITEVSGSGADGGDFVELRNVSPEAQDLSGWRLAIFEPGSRPYPAVSFVIPDGVRIEAGQTILFREGGPASPPASMFPTFLLGAQLNWGDDGYVNLFGGASFGVVLQDRSDSVVDSFFAGDADPVFLSSPGIFGSAGWSGPAVAPGDVSPYHFQRRGRENSRSSRDWIRGTVPTPGTADDGLAASFLDAVAVRVEPASTSGFVQGIWRGNIAFPLPTVSASVNVDDGNGHVGRSGFVTTHSDLDGDGMPDEWEIQFGLSFGDPNDGITDLDGDGVSAAHEYVAGTAPDDATSVLRLHLASGRLSFQGRAGRRYRLERRNQIASGQWELLETFEPASQGLRTAIATLPDGETGGFFRVTVQLP